MSSSLPRSPFNEIAMCLSGGGYRATAFHLGAMSYLNRLQFQGNTLLEHVKALSTVSGGTFTGVIYALKKQQGKSFDEIYKDLVEMLLTHDLVKESLEKLKGDGIWKNPRKRKNLINAFSEIYDELLTEGFTYGIFTQAQNTHIDLLCFNATEFTNGLNFRFQSEWKNYTLNGNLIRGSQKYRLRRETQDEIKLSDIIAASSCFPGGFEPIEFPGDFCHEKSTHLDNRIKENKPSLGLMDGGIYDNQGIDSIQLSEKRRGTSSAPRPYDLIIISDVSSSGISMPFQFHKKSASKIDHYSIAYLKNKIQRTKKSIYWSGAIMVIIGIFLVAYMQMADRLATGIGISLLAIGIIVIGIGIFISYVSSKINKSIIKLYKKNVDRFYQDKLASLNLSEYRLKEIEPLVMDRINSVLLMVKDVFLKQVRRLKYKSIYEDERYRFRRASNLINSLTEEDWNRTNSFQDLEDIPDDLRGEYQKVIGSKIKAVAEDAASFGTTLWFTDEDKLSNAINELLACGQISTCLMLMDYLLQLKNHKDYNAYSAPVRSSLEELFNSCLNDWRGFKKDPFTLV